MNAFTNRRVNSDVIFNIFLTIFCVLVFLIIAYPLYFIIIASFSRPDYVANGSVFIWPKGIQFEGYQKIFEDVRIWTGYKNTIIYSILGTTVNLLVTLPAAYVLSRKDFPLRHLVMRIFVFTMYFSGGMIPTYVLISKLGMINTLWVFIIPFCVNTYNLIIARSFFESNLPPEMLESAQLDGCSNWRFFLTIGLPLSKAVVSVIALYYFVAHWNNFFTGLMYTTRQDMIPLQLVLRQILIVNQVFLEGAGMGGDSGGFAQQLADIMKYGIIVVSTLPLLIIYPFIQKYFEKGVMIGAVKG